ncbi:uncharacterized protein [Antedon mediterranea]|uniref:uncharacterized protein n=1 Tax=Antedon mediterranea TaxID=105859 RepID=UPI003AF5705C
MKKTSRKSSGSKSSKESLISRGLAVKKIPKNRRDVQETTPGYSLYSTDSEDQVSMTTKGLDRCAALLANILEGEISLSQCKYNSNNVISQQPGITKNKSIISKQEKKSIDKVGSKDVTAFHRRLVTSTPTKKPKHENLTQEKMHKVHGTQSNIQEVDENQEGKKQNRLKAKQQVSNKHQGKQQQKHPKLKQKKKVIPCTVLKPSVTESKKQSNNQNKDLIKPNSQQSIRSNYKQDDDTVEENGTDDEGNLTPTNDGDQHLSSRGCSVPPPTAAKHCGNQIRTAKYLLNELHALLQDNGDVETQRLLSEMDQTLNTIPYSTNVTPSTSTETELALQPLRNENCHLRRKLRIANQRIRDIDSQLKDQDNPNLELLSSKAFIEVLQIKLKDAAKVIDKLKKENDETKTEQDVSSGENMAKTDALQKECDTLHKQLSQNKLDLKSTQLQLEAKKKECNIKDLCINQRDGEIKRMKEINENLQYTISSLLRDLKERPVKHPVPKMSEVTSAADRFKKPLPKFRTFDSNPKEKLGTRNSLANQTQGESVSDDIREMPNFKIPHMTSLESTAPLNLKVSPPHDVKDWILESSYDSQDEILHRDKLLHGDLDYNGMHAEEDKDEYEEQHISCISHVGYELPMDTTLDHLAHKRQDHQHKRPAHVSLLDHLAHKRQDHQHKRPAHVSLLDHLAHKRQDHQHKRPAHVSLLDHLAHKRQDHQHKRPAHVSFTDSHLDRLLVSSTSPINTFKLTDLSNITESTLSSVTSQDEYIFQEGLNKLDKDIETLQNNLIHMGVSLKYNTLPIAKTF